MPMFRPWFPQRLGPWVYLLIAFCFQLSAGAYLGALGSIVGGEAVMREDVTMMLYCNLAGLALWFPFLFRMKFRFTNKTLLCASALGVIICNVLMMHVKCLPLMWIICFVEGACKLQGTFECMSNVQLWMTPKRDFTVFFPVLHIILMTSIQANDILATNMAYYCTYYHANYVIIFLMLLILLFQFICCRHYRFMRSLPLFGIDWLGYVMWAVFVVLVAWLFNYGDWMRWYDSQTWRTVLASAIVLFALCVLRMCHIRHPFVSPEIFRTKHYLPILFICIVVEALMATEHVLEEVYYEEVMGWTDMQTVQLNWVALVGCVVGAGVAFFWTHTMRWNFFRCFTFGIALIVVYHAGFYFTISTDITPRQLYLPVFVRGMDVSILGAVMLLMLHELFDFQHFFQALSVFQVIHVTIGGCIGSACYAQALSKFVPENMARYGENINLVAFSRLHVDVGAFSEEFVRQMMEVSIKQAFGWCLYVGIALLLGALLYKHPVRRRLKRFPLWKTFGRTFLANG